MNGMEMLFKQLGFDPAKIIADFNNLKTGVEGTLTRIDARLQHIEAMTEEIWKANNPQAQPQPTMQPPPQMPQAEPPQVQEPQKPPPILQLVKQPAHQ